jgi:hypothetical protein
MSQSTLPLSQLFAVSVSVSPQSPATPQFNQLLITGTSSVIPSTTTRLLQFVGSTILTQILTAGFSNSSPEYVAAEQYMAQSPQPNYLWLGRQDLTALGTIGVGASGGTGYVVGDLLTVVQGGGSLGLAKVTTIGGSGAVTGVAIVSGSQGTGYAVANNLATTGGTGTGAEIDITAIGETALQAVQACRLASSAWYLVYATAAADADNILIVEYAQSVVPQMQVFFTTTNVAVYNPAVTTDIFSVLQAGNYNRYQGVFATTQGGTAPNNAYLAAGLAGVAMGRNTGLANSYFTLAFKQIVGMTPEPLTLAQFLAIQAKNGNAYVNFNNVYSWYQNSVTGSGQYFDTILGLDMLAADLQYGEANLLNSLPSVPQTDPGQAQLVHQANQDCQLSVNRGFIAPGIWTGQTLTVGNTTLSAGMSLASGYQCMSAPIAQQSSGARAARQAQPIYVAVILAGSMQSLVIAVYVQQ